MASSAIPAAQIATNRSVVLATYRHLLRSTRIAFKDDAGTLAAARQFARQQFDIGVRHESGSIAAAQGVEHAQGVSQILRENLVQGRNMGDNKYKLNIHEHTQRLDNDTAGNLKGTRKSFKDIKNSVF